MGPPWTLLRPLRAARASEWSPPREISLGYLRVDERGVRCPSSR